jgi:hypothetical protein
MTLWLYLASFLLIVIGLIKLLAGHRDKSVKEQKSQDLSNKAERLGKIADDLTQSWKS